MPSGRLAAVDLTANTNNDVYSPGAGKLASATLSLCNRTNAPISVRAAIAETATPSNAEWIEFGAVIPANGVLERTGLTLAGTQRIVINPSAAGVSGVVYGFEE